MDFLNDNPFPADFGNNSSYAEPTEGSPFDSGRGLVVYSHQDPLQITREPRTRIQFWTRTKVRIFKEALVFPFLGKRNAAFFYKASAS